MLADNRGLWAYSLRRLVDKDGIYICDDNWTSIGAYQPRNAMPGTRIIDNSCFAVSRRFGLTPVDDNHSDALSLALVCIDSVDLQEPARKAGKKGEKKVLNAKRKTRAEAKLAKQAAAELANIL